MSPLTRLPGRAWRLLGFAAWYTGELVLANATVARQVLTPRPRQVPGLVLVPLRSGREGHLALFSGLVTLTPGTLIVEIRTDPPEVLVHGLDVPDPDAFRRSVQEVEERMLAALDPRTAQERP